ncbi:glycoside hydrolase family 16 protein [Paenibacillus albus]|nr:glycoside hydrolase family 16 protein [Paenibacillus albus]
MTVGDRLMTGSDNGWKLIWNEDFEGPDIDLSRWDYDIGGHGWGNNERQYYTKEARNAYIKDSKLIIKAIQEEYEGSPYTSAKLVTRGKADWLYGRFEIRAKLPSGQGIWPAFWMLPTDPQLYGNWPSSGEIDMMEMVGKEPNRVHGTLHMGNPHIYKGGSFALAEGNFADHFHIFTLDWTPEQIRWYIDGELYHKSSEWYSRETEFAEPTPYPAPFNQPFYLMLNLAVGGYWPGSPDESTVLPQMLEVDYIRIYQPEDGKYGPAI